jgi:hypothetical protein
MSIAVNADGTNTGAKITSNAANSIHIVSAQFFNGASGTTYTIQAVVESGTVTRVQLTGAVNIFGAGQYANFSLTGAGSVLATAGGTGAGATIKRIGTTNKYIISFTVVATSTAAGASGVMVFINSDSATRLPSYTGTATDTFYVHYLGIEVGAFATSPIPTSGSAITRTADNASITGTNFSGFWNADEGTVYAEFALIPFNKTAYDRILEIGDGTSSNRFSFLINPTDDEPELDVFDGGVLQASPRSTITVNDGATYKSAFAYKVNDFAITTGGETVVTDNSGTLPVVNKLTVGLSNSASSFYLNGTIKTLKYWPYRASNADLEKVTT